MGRETIAHEGAIPSPCPPSPEKIVVTRIVGSVSYGFPCLCKSMENPKYVETKEVFGNDFFYLKSSLMRTLTLSPTGTCCSWLLPGGGVVAGVECGGGGRAEAPAAAVVSAGAGGQGGGGPGPLAAAHCPARGGHTA